MQNIVNQFSNINISQQYIKAGSLVLLVFVAVLLFAYIRKYFVKSSMDGMFLGIFFGFLLTLLLEGFLLIAGRTALTEFLGWKDAPKPISTVLDLGKEKLSEVLIDSGEIPVTYASNPSTDDALEVLQNLKPDDIKKIRGIICTP